MFLFFGVFVGGGGVKVEIVLPILVMIGCATCAKLILSIYFQ